MYTIRRSQIIKYKVNGFPTPDGCRDRLNAQGHKYKKLADKLML